MSERIKTYRELRVYQHALEAAMEIYHLSENFPSAEKYSLVDQMRRCSRSVCANVAEAWRKRRYKAAFIAKLSDAESEAAETQVWSEIAHRCRYIDESMREKLDTEYDQILGEIVRMIDQADKWLIHSKGK